VIRSFRLFPAILISLEEGYSITRGRWEMEDRIGKGRREYLQNFYDKIEDIRLLIKQKTQ